MMEKLSLEEEKESTVKFEELMLVGGKWDWSSRSEKDYDFVKELVYGSGDWTYFLAESSGAHFLFRRKKENDREKS